MPQKIASPRVTSEEFQEQGRRLLAAQLALWDAQTAFELRLNGGQELNFACMGEWASMFSEPEEATPQLIAEMVADILDNKEGK